MKRYPIPKPQYIPSGEQAAVPNDGTAACFCSTKTERFCHKLSWPAISKSVEEGLSWPRKEKHREKWAESPLSLVIMYRGTNMSPLFQRVVRT